MTLIADLARLGAAALSVAPVAVFAQGYAQPVVQPLPDPAALRLSEALRGLGQDPRSLPALIEAGQASIGLDDVDAAAGFFARAAAIAPDDGAVKAGLAVVASRQGRPIEALALFAEAEAAGEPMRLHAAERGLAYDLAGDNTRAQQEYAVSLSLAPDPEIVRRLAMSQAIAGDQRGSETTLLPLLQRRDLAAYRTRAFALAVLGKSDEAVSIAETMLPARVSSRLAPYLRYMPRLTRAQQAAAANLGVFPRAAEIGRDDPAIAAYAGPLAAIPPQQAAGSRLVPSGAPLGGRGSGEGGVPRRPPPAEVPAAPPVSPPAVIAPEPQLAESGSAPVVVAPEPSLAIEPVAGPPEPQLAEGGSAPVVVASEPSPAIDSAVGPPVPPLAESGPAPVVVAALPADTAGEAPRPSISLDEPPQAQPEVDVSLAEAFADLDLPPADAGPAEGAVDITRIEPRREAPRPAAPPPPPPHPSRQWVQVATGKDVDALRFDWRRIRRAAGGLLDKYDPHVAAWGQTNRLVAGPFASAREAQDFVSRLQEKQVDSFRFASAQGEEVRSLE